MLPAAMIFNSGSANMRATASETETVADSKKQKIALVPAEGDGSSIEVAKRPRGRPPGSKNKPKPPVIITRESEPSAAMRPHILEIPSGHDVIDSIVKYSRRKNLGVCVLSGNGAVSNVTLRQPPHPVAAVTGAATTVGFHGRFEILSLSATVMPPAVSAVLFSPGASVSLAGPQGQVMGGTVVGPLLAAGTVTVVAATFENPTFHRLPSVEEVVARSVSVSGGGDESSGQHQQQQHQHEEEEEEHEAEENQHHHQHYVHHREYQQQHHQYHQQQAAAESCGLAMYSSHFPSEVIWAPTARPPHPPPY